MTHNVRATLVTELKCVMIVHYDRPHNLSLEVKAFPEYLVALYFVELATIQRVFAGMKRLEIDRNRRQRGMEEGIADDG